MSAEALAKAPTAGDAHTSRTSGGLSATKFLIATIALPAVLMLMVVAERLLFLEKPAPWFGFDDGLRVSLLPFHYLFIFTENVGCIIGLAAALVALIPSARRAGVSLACWVSEHPYCVALVVFALLCCGTVVVSHDWPLTMDEYAPRLQAETFAGGSLAHRFGPAPLHRYLDRQYWDYFFAVDPRSATVASIYWPGFALILTPFAWAHIPWACNPAISAATALVIYKLAVRIGGHTLAGGWAMLFTVASPVFVSYGMSYYSMPAHLLANLLFAMLVFNGTPRGLFSAGLIGGLALTLHNPVPHLLFATPWFLSLLWRKRLKAVLLLTAGYIPADLLLGAGWPFVLDHVRAASAVSGNVVPAPAFGFFLSKLGKLAAVPDSFTVWVKGLEFAKLWLWAVPGMPLLALLFYRTERRGVRNSLLWLCAASMAATVAGYTFIALDQGHGWGYRYFHSVWGVLPLAAAVFVHRSGREADKEGVHWQSVAGGLVLGSLLIAVPARAFQSERFISWHLNHAITAPAQGRYAVFVAKTYPFSFDLVENLPQDQRVVRFVSFGRGEDARWISRFYPGAVLVSTDGRGSLWRLP